jgi:hypothetical protein
MCAFQGCPGCAVFDRCLARAADATEELELTATATDPTRKDVKLARELKSRAMSRDVEEQVMEIVHGQLVVLR